MQRIRLTSSHLVLLAQVFLIAGFVILTLRFSAQAPLADYPDTRQYIRMGHLPLTNSEFWAGIVPFTAALVYKVCGGDITCVADIQIALALVAWSALALVVARLVQAPLLKLCAMVVVLALGLSPNVIAWHKTLMSEALSNNLLILSTAAVLWLGWYLAQRPGLAAWRQLLAGLLVLPIIVLYSFARDPNSYMLLLSALFVAGLVLIFRKQTRPWWPVLGFFVVSIGVLFALQNVSISYSQRTVPTFPQNILIRVLPYPDRLTYFESRGMPVTPELLALNGQRAHIAYFKLF